MATTKVNTAPRAPFSDVDGDHEKKKEAKAGADTKGDSSQMVSCRGRKKNKISTNKGQQESSTSSTTSF